MQMYSEAMRNMRDAFYDPGMHGVDWPAVTEMYRPLVYKMSTKSELRDVLQQAFGELSVLHVFVSVRNDELAVGVGEPSACLGGSLVAKPGGVEVVRVYDTSGVLAAPDSPLSAMAVDLRPGDLITRVDGTLVNASDAPLSRMLLGKAGMQVLLEVDQKPRVPLDDDAEAILAQIHGAGGGVMGRGAVLGSGMGAVRAEGSGIGGSSGSHRVSSDADALPSVRRAAEAKRRRRFLEARFGAEAKAKAKANAEANATRSSADAPTRLLSGVRNVVVVPLSHEECTVLKSADALNHRRAYVSKKSRGALAYVYLEDMEQMGEGFSNSFDDFAAQFYPAIRNAGLIIDVRRNAGGNIDTWILERLRRVAWMFNAQRAGPGDTTMQYAFLGKVAVLVDEMTSSDAEIFAAGIQQLGLGKVIGARTWGGAVGYSSNPELALVDGSGFTIPSFGPYAAGAWMIEQRGVVPDIAVANDPVATFNGADAQLVAAVDHLMGLIAKAPNQERIPEKPEYPDWSFNRDVCRAGGDGGEVSREQRKGVLF
jgi:C-terminal processing protease CtpA/Prc